MVTWSAFEADAPEFAAAVRERFAVRKHATLATLRADGAPRISGTEVAFTPEGPQLGSMPGALKAKDLLRDPRCAIHSPTVDPPADDPSGWEGEAKIAGTAVVLPDGEGGSHAFGLDITEVVLTHVETEPDELVVEAWHPDRGYVVTRRA